MVYANMDEFLNSHDSDGIFSEKVLVYPSRKLCEIRLTATAIVIFNISLSGKISDTIVEVKFSDCIGCHCMKGHKRTDTQAYFTIYAYPKKKKTAGGIIKRRKLITLTVNKYDSYTENATVAAEWRTAIISMIRAIHLGKELKLSVQLPLRKMLVLVNPAGGQGRALSIFKEKAAPIFAEADIYYQVVVTDHQGQASEICKALSLTSWDGIVICSGDGLLHEVLQGLMQRSDWESAIKTPIGMLPGGSGNAVSAAINYNAGLPVKENFAFYSALIIAQGNPSPMDIVGIHLSSGRKLYSCLSVAWGIVSDIDIESERFRNFGSVRFTLGALARILDLRTYSGRVSFLPVSDYAYEQMDVHTGVLKRSKSVDNKIYPSSHLRTSQSVPSNLDHKAHMPHSRLSYWNLPEDQLHNTEEAKINGEVITGENMDHNLMYGSHGSGSKSHYYDSNHSTQSSGSGSSGEVPSHVSPDTELLVPLEQPVPDTWTTIEGEFVLVCAVYQSHLSNDSRFVPFAEFDDGVIYICIVRKGVSRSALLSLFVEIDSGGHISSPYFEIFPAHAFRIEPSMDQQPYIGERIMTVDGEKVEYGAVQGQVIPGLGRLITVHHSTML